MNSEQEAMEMAVGLMEAAMEGIMVHVRPMLVEKVVVVLQARRPIVDQSDEGLERLAGEICDAFFKSVTP